jgi:hypothetical protein
LAGSLYLSVLTLDERRQALSAWLETDLPECFAGRILSIDARAAERGEREGIYKDKKRKG